MKRVLILGYGALCYAIFLGTFLYAIWFVYTMDLATDGNTRSLAERVLIDAALLSVFALQHSIMARQWFKRAWTKVIPQATERSTYVLLSSLALLLLILFWQPILGPVWTVENSIGKAVLEVLFWAGWGMVLIGTFLIDHFELFGLKQVWAYYTGRPLQPPGFQ